MPIYIQIKASTRAKRAPIAPGGGSGQAEIPPQSFQVALYADGTWVCSKPLTAYWRYLFPGFPAGRWSKDMAQTIVLYDQSGQNEAFELRSVDKGQGVCFYWPRAGNRGATLFDGEGTWAPGAQTSQRMWIGPMVKGGGGAVVGYEGAVAAICSVDQPSHGAVLRLGTSRAGVVAGGAAGAGVLIVTGFDNPQQMGGFEFGQGDYALAFGAKWSSLTKAVQASKVAQALRAFDGGMLAISKAMELGKNSPKLQKALTECAGGAKSLVNSYGMLVDTDARTMTGVDIPLAGVGAEIGIFYGWSSASVLKSW